MHKAIILLEDGTCFYGNADTNQTHGTGEIAFNTGMTGYQEIFTDPSYFGQIIVMSASHIGNYGVHNEEIESDSIKIAGMVCKSFSQMHSRYTDKSSTLASYLTDNDTPYIYNIDTRELVTHIRDKGAMNAIISSKILDIEVLKNELAKTPSMDGLELSSKVTCDKAYEINSEGEYRIAVLDFGVKKNILRNLSRRNAHLKVFPSNTSVNEILDFNPDGIMLSNGPGDPSVMKDEIEVIKKLVDLNKPIFGICLGHQLLALSQGLKTKKMHNGHRGINHPVKNILTGKCEVTSQNHGFVVDYEVAENNSNIEITHIHLNDNTLAGIKVKNKDVFSVQYHPEASPGPNDSNYLFNQFLENIRKTKSN